MVLAGLGEERLNNIILGKIWCTVDKQNTRSNILSKGSSSKRNVTKDLTTLNIRLVYWQ